MIKLKEVIKSNKFTISLITSSLLASLGGFIFWIIVAHKYQASVLGKTYPQFSNIQLLTNFTVLGLGQSIFTNYRKNYRHKEYLIRRLAIVATFTVVTILIYNFFTLNSNIYTLILGVSIVCNIISTNAILSLKLPQLIFYEVTTTLLVKIISILALPANSESLIISLALGALSSTLASFLVLKIHQKKQIAYKDSKYTTIKSEITLSGTSYLANLFSLAPLLLLPAIVLHYKGPETTALISLLSLFLPLFNMPTSMAMRKFYHDILEGKNIRQEAIKILKLILPVMLTLNLITIIFASTILQILGKSYSADGSSILKTLSISATLAIGNYMVDTILLAKKYFKAYLLVNAAGSISIITVLIYALIFTDYNIGIVWIVGQLLYSAIALITLKIKYMS
jgi:hypothetical protein